MQVLDHCRKLTLVKPEGTRRVGEPKLRWVESVQEDVKKTGVGGEVSGPRRVEDNFRTG